MKTDPSPGFMKQFMNSKPAEKGKTKSASDKKKKKGAPLLAAFGK
jgi:hypothetical protein